MLSLQMNNLTDTLRSHLPPTDTRFRPDLTSWENAKLTEAHKNQKKMEILGEKRKKAIKEILKNEKDVIMEDDRTWYAPRFFKKIISQDENGMMIYDYKIDGNKYWERREKGNWEGSPKIFEDDCEPFR